MSKRVICDICVKEYNENEGISSNRVSSICALRRHFVCSEKCLHKLKEYYRCVGCKNLTSFSCASCRKSICGACEKKCNNGNLGIFSFCSDECVEIMENKYACLGCRTLTNNTCSKCSISICVECRTICKDCHFYGCQACFQIHNGKECINCKEFGVSNKTCQCNRHSSNYCFICKLSGKTIDITFDCKITSCSNNCKLYVCKNHFDLNNLMNKEEWENFKVLSLCCFCKKFLCFAHDNYSCYNKCYTLMMCDDCGDIKDILKRKFTDLQNKILLQYLFSLS